MGALFGGSQWTSRSEIPHTAGKTPSFDNSGKTFAFRSPLDSHFITYRKKLFKFIFSKYIIAIIF